MNGDRADFADSTVGEDEHEPLVRADRPAAAAAAAGVEQQLHNRCAVLGEGDELEVAVEVAHYEPPAAAVKSRHRFRSPCGVRETVRWVPALCPRARRAAAAPRRHARGASAPRAVAASEMLASKLLLIWNL
jgi:hypothetical protein